MALQAKNKFSLSLRALSQMMGLQKLLLYRTAGNTGRSFQFACGTQTDEAPQDLILIEAGLSPEQIYCVQKEELGKPHAMLDPQPSGGAPTPGSLCLVPLFSKEELSGVALLSLEDSAGAVLEHIGLLSSELAELLMSSAQGGGQSGPIAFERWMRQTISKLFASLDRDYMLQTLVDSLGRAFRPSRCLVVRQTGTAITGLASQVSHEYEEPDLSPLGLGRTGQFPPFAIALFSQRCTGYGDLDELSSAGEFSEKESELLLDNGVVALAGAPLLNQGVPYGVVLLVQNSKRQWSKSELEYIEIVVAQASIALSHCLNQHELKDQLFHSSLMGNLTEQLTYALETAVRLPKGATKTEERPMFETAESASLSNREMEVLRLIASGYANKEIAQRLFLTESTVELHASRIRKKLKLKSRTALVKYACDNGLV